MSTTERLCAETEVPENGPIRVTLREDVDICVGKINGRYYAVPDRCGHMNGPISRGELEGTVVTCPMHQAQFDLATGALVRPPNNPQPQPRPEGAAPPAPEARPAPAGGLNPALRQMVRTLALPRLELRFEGGDLLVEFP